MKKSLKNLKKSIVLTVLLVFTMGLQGQQLILRDHIEGAWQGNLDAGGIKLTLVLNINTDTDHNLKASLDSPDQGAKNIKVNKIEVKADSLTFSSEMIKGSYSGKWDRSTGVINGKWKQAGVELELNLTKTDKPLVYKRPQEPIPPFPYKTEEISFVNQNGKISLAGTLTIPQGQGPFPACILISGSGPQNRDSELLGHKPFLVMADYLTKKGYAVLRYDDRGTGYSGGNFSTADILDFATDAKAGFDFLRNDKRIISSKIGFLGHSEGGIIAPIIATQNLATAFIILLAGPAVKGEEILYSQEELISKANAVNEKEIKTNLNIQREVFSIIKKTSDTVVTALKVKEILQKELPKTELWKSMNAESRSEYLGIQVNTLNSRWFRNFLTLDPSDYLEQVRCPVLAIYGEKDLQVPPDLNIKPLKKALSKAGNADYQVLQLPGLNHLFQKATTGSPNEYVSIEETISPKVLDIISAWLALKTK
ncbi:MAG: alpha/beta hydrolase family protein [Bacteroidales bacterium]